MRLEPRPNDSPVTANVRIIDQTMIMADNPGLKTESRRAGAERTYIGVFRTWISQDRDQDGTPVGRVLTWGVKLVQAADGTITRAEAVPIRPETFVALRNYVTGTGGRP